LPAPRCSFAGSADGCHHRQPCSPDRRRSGCAARSHHGPQAAAKCIEAELSPLLEQLSGALEAGELDASFSHNGCSFCWSAGRTSYAYPEPLQQQEQALKEAQRLAVATGAATEKHGKAFWTIKPGRS